MFEIPDWAYEFHGHRCPFMPLGYRMGTRAMELLGVDRSRNQEMHVIAEMGIGHPQGCLLDGIMASTGATFGKGMIEKVNYGKVAAKFYFPGKGAVRLVLNPDFIDSISTHEFFALRKKGIQPTEIPSEVTDDIINVVLSADDDVLFKVTHSPDHTFSRAPVSFNKVKCERCGEYVFERYIRRQDGKLLCLPCTGYHQHEYLFPVSNK